MIQRTILEWESLPYGDDPKDVASIPGLVADRIAAVAAASPLAGRGGGGVLEHGRKALRARGVVGVIAAEGGALEILPKIESRADTDVAQIGSIRRRLVHMLAVALDINVDVGQFTALDWQRDTLLEILIRLFTDKLVEAVRKGMPRRYVVDENDLATLRGRLDVTRQFTVLATNPSRLACRYDALSPDIALNQIMKAAVTRLASIARSGENRRRLRELGFAYADIADVPVSALRWNELVLDRTNARWRELLSMAKLLLGQRFQTTSAGEGKGFSLLFEMNVLFEEYIARMIRRVLAGTDLSVVSQGGRLYCLRTDGNEELFQTKPDILVKRGSDVVQIIDTKWKRIGARIDDAKQGVAQADVYQMMAYGRLYDSLRMTLLYPHHAGLHGDEGMQASYWIAASEQRLETATVDVSADEGVRACLRTIIVPYH